MLKNLGARMRELRKQKGLTLVEIAEKTGVAQATLSRIETGVMIGTIESHAKIAEVIGVGLPELYQDIDDRASKTAHVKEEDQKKATIHSKNVKITLLTQQVADKKITPLLIELASGAETEKEKKERGVEKFIWAQEGSVKIKLEKETFELKSGDTFYFDASYPHQIVNESSKSARVFVAISPAKI
jgi:transcriptional regulator with XRE-family HTH domain